VLSPRFVEGRPGDAEEADNRHCLLLRVQLPRRCHCASQQEQKLAAVHSMTSSARARTAGGTVRPSDFAVFRLMTSRNLVGCWTGRSAGLAPFRILST
jgi:hypothetical protein